MGTNGASNVHQANSKAWRRIPSAQRVQITLPPHVEALQSQTARAFLVILGTTLGAILRQWAPGLKTVSFFRAQPTAPLPASRAARRWIVFACLGSLY